MSTINYKEMIDEAITTNKPVSRKIDISSTKKDDKSTKTFTSFKEMLNELSSTHSVVTRKINVISNDKQE